MASTQIDNALISVKAADIEGLSEQQLPQLLKILLDNSALLMGAPLGCWHVNADTKAADGGVDASISWSAKPEAIADWFPGTDVVFQCKACKKFGPTQCSVELLSPKNGLIRPAVRDTLRRGGKYVLVVVLDWTDQDRRKRIAAMVDQIARKDPTLPRKNRILIWDAGVLASWVNRFPSAVVQVLSWLGKQPPDGLLTWDMLSNDVKYANPFHASPDQKAAIDTLKSQLSQHKLWRIVGMPGAGKTRLLVETLRPDDGCGVLPSVLTHASVYVDEASTGPYGVRHSWSWVKSLKVPCTFIVDNCNDDEYLWLAQEVANSTKGTVVVALSTSPYSLLSQPTTIVLDRAPDNTIKQIVVDCNPNLTQPDIEFAIRQAQGLPGVARIVVSQLRGDSYDIQAVMDQSSIGTMLANTAALSDGERLCLTATALFTRVGYSGPSNTECDHVAKFLCHGMSAEVFLQMIDRLVAQSYVRRVNGSLAVFPRILGQRIAYDWWRSVDQHVVSVLMHGLPDDLLVSFCERLGQLYFSDTAKKAVEYLCGSTGPLSDPEYLVTSTGARLLSAVAECNPKAAARLVEGTFSSFTPDQARSAMISGEALIEVMGKLCWWREHFDAAAPVLLLFAAGERPQHHEYVAKQYCGLFRLALPGTQKPLLERLGTLDDALESRFDECRVLAVEALCDALTTGSFVRLGGIQAQGDRQPGLDYWPHFKHEILDYLHEISWRLARSLRSREPAVKEAAATGFIRKLSGLVVSGFQDAADHVVLSIIEDAREYLPALRNQVLQLLDDPREFDRAGSRAWLEAMAPMSVTERIRMDVLEAPQFFRSKDAESAADARIADLARYCGDHAKELADIISVLIEETDSPGRRFIFGKELAGSLGNPWGTVDMFLDAIRASTYRAERVDVAVLGGLLAALRIQDNSRVEMILDTIIQDTTLLPFLTVLTARSNGTLPSVQRCVDAAVRGEIKVSSLEPLNYTYVLEKLNPSDVARLAESLHSLGTDEALRLSLALICTRTLANKYKLPIEIRPSLRSLIMDHHLAMSLRNDGQSLDWYWWTLAATWLLHDQDDRELAEDVVRQLLSGFDTDDLDPWYYQVDAVATVLLQEYWSLVWTLAVDMAAVKGSVGTERARMAFSGQAGDREDFELGFARVTLQEGRDWCTADPVHAPVLLLQLVPIAVRDAGVDGYSWNEVARYVMDQYGNAAEVQVALGRRLNGFSGWGYRGNSVRQVAQLYRQLEQSPNGEVHRWARTVRHEMEVRADQLDLQIEGNEKAADLL